MELKQLLPILSKVRLWLLIELYGIETKEKPGTKKPPGRLLIELYGIETKLTRLAPAKPGAFNRTIWN